MNLRQQHIHMKNIEIFYLPPQSLRTSVGMSQ